MSTDHSHEDDEHEHDHAEPEPAPFGSDPVLGRTALICDAGTSVGREIALALGERDARVILAGPTRTTLLETLTAADAGHADARVVELDPSGPDGSGGALDGEDVSILVITPEVEDPAALCRALAPHLRLAGSGHVITALPVTGDLGPFIRVDQLPADHLTPAAVLALLTSAAALTP